MKTIHAPNAPAAIGPYSHAIYAGDLLFTSGQIPTDPQTGKIVKGDITVQVKQVFSNLEAILSEAGMTFQNAVKLTVYMIDLADFQKLNAIYATYFPDNPPARSCVQVAALPNGAQVEIELIASK